MQATSTHTGVESLYRSHKWSSSFCALSGECWTIGLPWYRTWEGPKTFLQSCRVPVADFCCWELHRFSLIRLLQYVVLVTYYVFYYPFYIRNEISPWKTSSLNLPCSVWSINISLIGFSLLFRFLFPSRPCYFAHLPCAIREVWRHYWQIFDVGSSKAVHVWEIMCRVFWQGQGVDSGENEGKLILLRVSSMDSQPWDFH